MWPSKYAAKASLYSADESLSLCFGLGIHGLTLFHSEELNRVARKSLLEREAGQSATKKFSKVPSPIGFWPRILSNEPLPGPARASYSFGTTRRFLRFASMLMTRSVTRRKRPAGIMRVPDIAGHNKPKSARESTMVSAIPRRRRPEPHLSPKSC